jgi:hypothetical protein
MSPPVGSLSILQYCFFFFLLRQLLSLRHHDRGELAASSSDSVLLVRLARDGFCFCVVAAFLVFRGCAVSPVVVIQIRGAGGSETGSSSGCCCVM